MIKNIFTIAYSEEEANEIGHFVMSKGYEGIQNDSYRYCKDKIWWEYKESKRHNFNYIYIGAGSTQLVISRTKRRLRRRGFKYVEKKRMFYKLLSRCNEL